MLSHRWKLTEGFLQDTSLHGLQYVAHKQYNGFEKAFWALVFVAGLSVSIFFVTKVYSTWQDNPIVMTVESTNEPIKSIKFPAVTLCPTQQILLWKLKLLRGKLNITSNSSINGQQLLMGLQQSSEFDETDSKFGNTPNEVLRQLAEFFVTASMSFFDSTKFVAPNCDDMIINCTWKNKYNCISSLSTILTPMGYCCAFNFPDFNRPNAELYQTAYKGKGFGLKLVIHPQNKDKWSNMVEMGHEVLVHDQDTYPYRPALEMQVGPGEILHVAVEPVLTASDDGVRSVSRIKRDCSFGDEYQLGLKLPQTYNNCILDCFHKHQLAKCKCVQGYIQTFNPCAQVCGLLKVACLQQTLMDVMEDLDKMCQCRPPCEEIAYNAHSTIRNMTFFDLTFTSLDLRNTTFRNYALIHVFFKESRFTKYRRSLRYQWEDFIAAAGGLLGVGVGFSLLSAVEVIYFFCYKFWVSGISPKSPTKPVYEKPPLETLKTLNDNYFNDHIFVRRNSSRTILAIIHDLEA